MALVYTTVLSEKVIACTRHVQTQHNATPIIYKEKRLIIFFILTIYDILSIIFTFNLIAVPIRISVPNTTSSPHQRLIAFSKLSISASALSYNCDSETEDNEGA